VHDVLELRMTGHNLACLTTIGARWRGIADPSMR